MPCVRTHSNAPCVHQHSTASCVQANSISSTAPCDRNIRYLKKDLYIDIGIACDAYLVFIHSIDICVFIHAYILMHTCLLMHTLWCIHLAKHTFNFLIQVYLSTCLCISMSLYLYVHVCVMASFFLCILNSSYLSFYTFWYAQVSLCPFLSVHIFLSV